MTAAPKQLALIITELDPGGAERCLVELATRIDRQRFSPVVYSLGPPPREGRQQLVSRLAELGIPTQFLALTGWVQFFRGVKRLSAMLREQQPDIVQTFLFHANVVGTRAARMAGAQRVFTGMRVADPRWWRTLLERAAAQSADRYICVSQNVSEFYRRQGFSAGKLIVIPNGIDVAPWREAVPTSLLPFGVPNGRRVMLFVGRLDQQKGLDRFFAELPAIFRALPQHDLLLVGDGPQAALLRRLTGRFGVQSRVHFGGWQANVPPIMAAADVLVLPSRWEGMPNVVLEAMAAGKPVVATQAEGTVELLGLAAMEQTVPVGDWQKFGSQIVEICKNESLAKDLGKLNQARAQQFTIDSAVGRYQLLYEAALDL